MSDTKETGDKAANARGKPLTLNVKRTESAGHVKQSFSHGRMKSVVVEKKKARRIVPPTTPAPAQTAEAPQRSEPQRAPQSTPGAGQRAPGGSQPMSRGGGSSPGGRTLSDGEREARIRALAVARERELEDRRRNEEEARRRAEREEEAKRLQEEVRQKAEIEARQRAAEQADQPKKEPVAEQPTVVETPRKPVVVSTRPGQLQDDTPVLPKRGEIEVPRRTGGPVGKRPEQVEDEDDGRNKKPRPGAPKAVMKPEKAPVKRVSDDRRTRLTINNAFDDRQREQSIAAWKRKIERQKKQQLGANQGPREKFQRDVVIPEAITIQELANRMAERGVDIIKFLMKQGDMRLITDVIDADTAQLIVEEFGHTPKRVAESDVEEGFIGIADTDEAKITRAPIVTIMGHVDHGKTSLLDAIREADVASGEAGGITQHIGAYQVVTKSGHKITFIDTPGHEAFTAMRARGAKATDIVILVVAADDGVMPQTIEAINHAKAAKVPIIVAINKMDKPSADPSRVRNELLRYEVVVESMSGDVLDVEVSALKKTNLDKLLETIVLQAELLDLKANADRSAEGVVIEAKLEAGRGPVGTMLVQRGTLKVGDIVVAGASWGRVRALINDHGEQVREAGPSVPVEVLGFSSAPEAGDPFAVVENESRARELTDYRARKRREKVSGGGGTALTLEQMMSRLKGEGRKDLPLVVKGDVQGSVEAISAALDKLATDEVGVRIVHAAVGGITESDIALASATGAVLLGFNVRANTQARAHAERDGVEIRYYAIIYDLVDEVKKALSGMLAPTQREVFLGNAQILEVFNISKVGKVAGCRITDGKVERGAEVRLIRDNVVIHRGKLSTLKRFKDEVKEVPSGQECGMAFEAYQDMRAGDVIECFRVETIARTL